MEAETRDFIGCSKGVALSSCRCKAQYHTLWREEYKHIVGWERAMFGWHTFFSYRQCTTLCSRGIFIISPHNHSLIFLFSLSSLKSSPLPPPPSSSSSPPSPSLTTAIASVHHHHHRHRSETQKWERMQSCRSWRERTKSENDDEDDDDNYCRRQREMVMVLVRFEMTIMVVVGFDGGEREGLWTVVMAAIMVVLVECYVAKRVGRRYRDGRDVDGGVRG